MDLGSDVIDEPREHCDRCGGYSESRVFQSEFGLICQLCAQRDPHEISKKSRSIIRQYFWGLCSNLICLPFDFLIHFEVGLPSIFGYAFSVLLILCIVNFFSVISALDTAKELTRAGSYLGFQIMFGLHTLSIPIAALVLFLHSLLFFTPQFMAANQLFFTFTGLFATGITFIYCSFFERGEPTKLEKGQ